MTLKVNSWHHAANKRIANRLRVSARAPDKVVEAVEMRYPGNPNCWGIQFHPEYVDANKNPLEYELHSRILKSFWKASLQFQYKGILLRDIKTCRFFSDAQNVSEVTKTVSIQSKL